MNGPIYPPAQFTTVPIRIQIAEWSLQMALRMCDNARRYGTWTPEQPASPPAMAAIAKRYWWRYKGWHRGERVGGTSVNIYSIQVVRTVLAFLCSVSVSCCCCCWWTPLSFLYKIDRSIDRQTASLLVQHSCRWATIEFNCIIIAMPSVPHRRRRRTLRRTLQISSSCGRRMEGQSTWQYNRGGWGFIVVDWLGRKWRRATRRSVVVGRRRRTPLHNNFINLSWLDGVEK